ncbi:MAG: prepilin-type N-terminal cleavage/methylation domain-containing protein [Deltaproteobacteria bacterium]|nr:prepilin-type N-terminal cleavage/methylation domain-containing protein [Deltaproteobacteria bacterium]
MSTATPLQRHRAQGKVAGFTLLELMIVVVIIGILATVAGQSYKRFTRRARVQEAISMLGDIRIKQENYYQTYHRYVSTGASDQDFHPKLMEWITLKTTWGIDCTKPGDVTAYPGWCALGAGYKSGEEANFQLLVIGRDPTSPQVPPVKYVTNPNVDWWYARARADFDNDGVFSDIYLSSEMREPVLEDELE